MLTPGTLVLDSKTRSGEITVGNPGDTVSTFCVEDSAFVQKQDGQLFANTNPKPVFGAQDMPRVGPRRFVLASGEGRQFVWPLACRPDWRLASTALT
jgi:hypothetical protein